MKEIGRKLFILRTLHNYTQNYVAEKLNISGSTYLAMEQGFTNIHYNRLESLLAIYNMTLNDFFSFTEEDILNLVTGKGLARPNIESPAWSRLVMKLETFNSVLLQLLEMTMENLKSIKKQLTVRPK